MSEAAEPFVAAHAPPPGSGGGQVNLFQPPPPQEPSDARDELLHLVQVADALLAELPDTDTDTDTDEPARNGDSQPDDQGADSSVSPRLRSPRLRRQVCTVRDLVRQAAVTLDETEQRVAWARAKAAKVLADAQAEVTARRTATDEFVVRTRQAAQVEVERALSDAQARSDDLLTEIEEVVESWLEEAESEAAHIREQARLEARRLVADAAEVDTHRAAELVARAVAEANQLRGRAETEAARILANAEEEARARSEAAECEAIATRARVRNEVESAEEQLERLNRSLAQVFGTDPPGPVVDPVVHPVDDAVAADPPEAAEIVPAEASPAEASPAEASPAEASPAEASPAEASPAEASPAEASPSVGLVALLASDTKPDDWMVIAHEPIAAPEEHRRGFFSRLFHRRHHSEAA